MDGAALFGVTPERRATRRPGPTRRRGRPPAAMLPPVVATGAPGHPDWLFHDLTISGAEAELAAFRHAAAGAGVVPWQYDYDRMEEDWFHLLVAPNPPQKRTISVHGARILARQLREAVWDLHEEAVSQVGIARGCPFDLHALLPVPPRILRLGPDAPESLAWLREHWGTTWPLRHVTLLPSGEQTGGQGEASALRCSFWSADWSPWPALRTLRGRWPGLGFELRPFYGPGGKEPGGKEPRGEKRRGKKAPAVR